MSQTLDLPALPSAAPLLAPLYQRLLHRLLAGIGRGSLTLTTPEGHTLRHAAPLPGPAGVLVLHRWRALRRLLLGGDVAFAEAFLDADWSSPDLAGLLDLAARNQAVVALARPAWPARLRNRLHHRRRANTRAGSRRNITAHYDLGNEFYAAWLDAGMTYSAALWPTPDLSLEAAQTAKQDRILALLDARPGQSMLEIGIGWGGMAERLAERGCAVTGVTLSPAQLTYAQARLAGRADLRLQDYRDLSGQYAGIVSIEMLEAVGEAYWPTYFAKLAQSLAPGGRAVVQAITIAEDHFAGYRAAPDFIQRHVFPGGMLPTPGIIARQAAQAGLRITAQQHFGADYARTLAEWRARFEAAWPRLAAQGFDARFQRLWTYYLCYCEAGFRAGVLDVGLWRLEPAP